MYSADKIQAARQFVLDLMDSAESFEEIAERVNLNQEHIRNLAPKSSYIPGSTINDRNRQFIIESIRPNRFDPRINGAMTRPIRDNQSIRGSEWREYPGFECSISISHSDFWQSMILCRLGIHQQAHSRAIIFLRDYPNLKYIAAEMAITQ